jgi:hypothetical protein
MLTFNKIINKVVNLENNIFSSNYDKNDKLPGVQKFFFSMLSNIHIYHIYKNKFEFMNQTLNNFYFLNKHDEKEQFIDLFCKIQKTYHTLNRFLYIYKLKKSKLIVNTDLQLNTIEEGKQNVMCIYHVNSKYLFKIEELLKIIYTSLTNSPYFFSEPITIKNPYNNIPFGKSVLYNIYFYLILNTKINLIRHEYLDIFLKFKECNFNMTKFVDNYEYVLREYAIKNYLLNSTKDTIAEQIKGMIIIYNAKVRLESNKIRISQDFPQEKLIEIMKPYLYLNFVSYYSLVHKNKCEAENNLIIKLREFQQFNPQFGRKICRFKDIIKDGRTKRIKSHIEFNMKHKKFNKFEISSFMKNHLDYDCDDDEEDEIQEPEYPFNISSNFFIEPYIENNEVAEMEEEEMEMEVEEDVEEEEGVNDEEGEDADDEEDYDENDSVS